MSGQHRRQNGNILLVVLFTIGALIIPLLMLFSQCGISLIERGRIQNVVEGACLVAANDLSRVIVNDPSFGYVSLSNHPPTGSATRAPDGEPLPVTGINTLIGTIRQNTIVARELENPTMGVLVESDRALLNATIAQLNTALIDSLNSENSGRWQDVRGQEIEPVRDVIKFLEANLPKDVQLESVRLSNGWLANGGSTTIAVPKPQDKSHVPIWLANGNFYKPFVQVPVGDALFSFAGLGSTSTIVNPSEFREADDEHICSIVKIECTLVRKRAPIMAVWLADGMKTQFVACCQPFTLPDSSTNGVMTIRFSGSPVSGLQSWNDFLRKGNFHDNQISTYNIAGGDYGIDSEARMNLTSSEETHSTSQQFAEHFYYWLRNGRLRPRLDAVLAMVNEQFPLAPGQIYVYEFTPHGEILRQNISSASVPYPVTADAQHSSVVDTSIANGMTPVIVFRDNVKHLGTITGGKHGGQPLAGYPFGLSEKHNCTSPEQLMGRFGKRTVFTHGLALDIEIGGIRESTAMRDVESMRQISRRI